jgi:hypothetical protein
VDRSLCRSFFMVKKWMGFAIAFWTILTVGLILVVGLIEVYTLPTSRRTVANVAVQPPNTDAQYLASGSWSSYYPDSVNVDANGLIRYAAFGLLKIDNGTTAHTSLSSVVPNLSSALVNASQALFTTTSNLLYGQLRLETFEFTFPPSTNIFLIMEQKNTFVLTPCRPVNRTSNGPYVGQILFVGSYNCEFGASPFGQPGDLNDVNTTLFYLLSVNARYQAVVFSSNSSGLMSVMNRALSNASVVSGQVEYAIMGVAPLILGNGAIRSNSTLGLAQYYDLKSVV